MSNENYNREQINKEMSAGEIVLLYYNDIYSKSMINKIIIGTILKLQLKKYIVIEGKNEELVIRISESKEKLRISEKFILECIKYCDSEKDKELSIKEIKNNKIFSRHKNEIQELIIQEAISDGLVDLERNKKKKGIFIKAFKRTFFILVLLLILLFLGFREISTFVLAFALVFIYKRKLKSKILVKLKDRLILEEKKMNLYQEENKKWKKTLLEFFIIAFLAFCNFYLIGEIHRIVPYGVLILLIEILIITINALILYRKSNNINIFSNTANKEKENLKNLNNYLNDYSLIEEKDVIDIYLWEDYLLYATIFGISKNVTETLKVNLENNKEKYDIKYDYYENKYFYINNLDRKIYLNIE